jgi:hypothetical protein
MNKSVALAFGSFVLGVGISAAADPPQMKEGYWQILTVTISNPGNKKIDGKETICRTHAYDQYAQDAAKKRSQNTCRMLTDSFSGGVYTVEQECTVAGSKVHSKTVTTPKGDSAIHAETHTTNTPALYGVAESTMTMDQTYIGACPAGVQPGDIFGAAGNKMSSWKH